VLATGLHPLRSRTDGQTDRLAPHASLAGMGTASGGPEAGDGVSIPLRWGHPAVGPIHPWHRRPGPWGTGTWPGVPVSEGLPRGGGEGAGWWSQVPRDAPGRKGPQTLVTVPEAPAPQAICGAKGKRKIRASFEREAGKDQCWRRRGRVRQG